MKHLLNNYLKNLAFRGKKLLSRGAELLIYAHLFFLISAREEGGGPQFKTTERAPSFRSWNVAQVDGRKT